MSDCKGDSGVSKKVAVAIIHGIGQQRKDYGQEMIGRLKAHFGDCAADIEIRTVYWAQVLEEKEERLWTQTRKGGAMDWQRLREVAIYFVADAIAYQITPSNRSVYDAIHAEFAQTLHELAGDAGGDAPLCVIAHSLGSVIASNYFYDLQMEQADLTKPVTQRKQRVPHAVQERRGDSPLEYGKTLTHMFTLGSPIALWSLRYEDFDRPISVPAPTLREYYPNLVGKWLNIYDRDDVVAFPLKKLNDAYDAVITQDVDLNVGTWTTSWNPLSHVEYWVDKQVLDILVGEIVQVWKVINGRG